MPLSTLSLSRGLGPNAPHAIKDFPGIEVAPIAAAMSAHFDAAIGDILKADQIAATPLRD